MPPSSELVNLDFMANRAEVIQHPNAFDVGMHDRPRACSVMVHLRAIHIVDSFKLI